MNSKEKTLAAECVFNFTHYDCIGFDLDNTLARYKIGEVIDLEYRIMSNFLVNKKGYSERHLLKPLDHSFMVKGLVIDDEHGNVLKIDATGEIKMASHGTKMLSDTEIGAFYKNKHWKETDNLILDPLKHWHASKMGPLIDYYDIPVSVLFGRAVDWIDESKGRQRGYHIWSDIIDSMIYMFHRDHFKLGIGEYFSTLHTDPEKYYYKCSDRLLRWLKALKSTGIILFLVTGSNTDFAMHTAAYTLGPEWRELFDLVVCRAEKPDFFTQQKPFYRVNDGQTGKRVKRSDELHRGGLYTRGNWTDLCKFVQKYCTVKNPKFLYVGDHLVHDVYTPCVYKSCDAVAVCEELEAEGHHGHQQWHPDSHFLVSTVWGSFFHNNHWYEMMTKCSKLCIPSMEYAATFSINHTFQKYL